MTADGTSDEYADRYLKPLPCHTGGNAVEAVYGYPRGTANRLAAVRGDIEEALEAANFIMWKGSDGKRQFHFFTVGGHGTCRASISALALPPATFKHPNDTRAFQRALTKAGYAALDRDDVVFGARATLTFQRSKGKVRNYLVRRTGWTTWKRVRGTRADLGTVSAGQRYEVQVIAHGPAAYTKTVGAAFTAR